MERTSFLIDIPILLIFGFLIGLLCRNHYKKYSFKPMFLQFWLVMIFLTISLAMFCEIEGGLFGGLKDGTFEIGKFFFADYFISHPDATSCQFMFSSGIFEVPFNNLSELANYPDFMFFAIATFLAYPLLPKLGCKLCWIMLGRKKTDKGLIGLLK